MNKVKIFICCHKPDTVKHDDVYTPLHVGRALSKYKEEMKDMIGDDTGENISEKNPFYSEATGIYWIWKNVHDTEYVGLCHYRRFFDCNFTNENIDGFFKDGTEVILARKTLHEHTRHYTLLKYIQQEDFCILQLVLKKLYPDYLTTLNRLSSDFYSSCYNMVVCRKELYDEYAKWLFSICFEMEKYVKYSGYNNAKRVFAYITELLTPVYFEYNKKKIKEIDIVFNGKKVSYSLPVRLKYWILRLVDYKLTPKTVVIGSSTFRGLDLDGMCQH